MVPEISLRLASVMTALHDVVAPAVDAANRPALEQLHLVLENLKLIQIQHDKIMHMRLLEIRESTRLLRGLRALGCTVAADAPLLAAATEAQSLVLPAYADLANLAQRLRAAVDTTIENPGISTPEARSAIRRLVIDVSRSEILRERAWVGSAGVDPDLAELPELERLLSSAGDSSPIATSDHP